MATEKELISATEEVKTKSQTAYLSNEGRYTLFKYGDTEIRIIAPKALEGYLEVTEWERGYIVVQTKYSHTDEPIEEYIDLVPVLEDLFIDPDSFLESIRCVEVKHD